MTKKIFFRIGIASSIIYTSYIEYTRYNIKPNLLKLEFNLGSADDIVRDNLRTGDVVLFNRRWYHYHIPMAIVIKLYQIINNSNFDHCGIIVQDKLGVPHVFESTPFGGCSLYKFENRILVSQSHQIIVIPLFSKQDKGITIDQREDMHNYSMDIINNKKINSEFFGLTKNIIITILKSTPLRSNLKDIYSCSNTELVINSWKKLGLNVSTLEQNIELTTIKSLIDRRIILKPFYLGEDILMRTK
jgi:hypothetical protein